MGRISQAMTTKSRAIQLPDPDASSTPAPAPASDPDAVERAIADYMQDKVVAEREKVFGERLLRAEDLVRVAHLGPAAADRLRMAACGSADGFLTWWQAALEEMVSQSIPDATAETVTQRLAGIPTYQIDQIDENTGGSAPWEAIWNNAVKLELNPRQKKAWNAEKAARNRYRMDAIAGWVACSFGLRFNLKPEQAAKLEQMVGPVMVKYDGSLSAYYQSSQPWYMDPSTTYVPLAGIAPADFKGLLTKEQLDRWNASGIGSQIAMEWQALSR